VQLVDDDGALLLWQVEAHHDGVLAVGAAGGDRDLVGAGPGQQRPPGRTSGGTATRGMRR